MSEFFTKKSNEAVPVTPITPKKLKLWLEEQDERTRAYVKANRFKGAPQSVLQLFDKDGYPTRVLVGIDKADKLYSYAQISKDLPARAYFIDAPLNEHDATQAAIGWALGQYRFDAYFEKKNEKPNKLVMPPKADAKLVESTISAVTLVRDLVNTPANDLGPEELSKAAQTLAKEFNGKCKTDIVGEELLKKNYPLVHAVGKGSDRAPRLIDFSWGPKDAPKVTLVGKGVVFDTGGNNIKPGGSMGIMKKDMGGAAHVLGLARMIMENDLNVQLRVLIPAVENSINGRAMRPGDVYPSRKGLTVEIENTDAEGRLILADALAEAAKDKPDLIIDFATLTGAARVALGPDVPPLFTDNDDLADEFEKAGQSLQDPLWQLPLLNDLYARMRGNNIADICHTGGGQGGAITAALFLKKFIDDSKKWVHIDTWAWRAENRPGRPMGGDAIGMRAAYDVIKNRYGTAPKKPKK
mgnify:CR=1 FL=1